MTHTLPSTMTGAVLPGDSTVQLHEFPVPVPGPGQVLLRMKASSICGSDVRAIYRAHLGTGPEGYQDGTIAGHELCGIVEAVGPECRKFAPGDRAVVYHIGGCGLCRACLAGWMIGCHSPLRAAYGWQRNGGNAPFLLADEKVLVALPPELTYVDGAMVACGLGTAYAVCLRAAISGRDKALITGIGPVGLGAALLCRAMGARVVGVEGQPARQELAAQLGFEEVVAPGDAALPDLMALSQGNGFEVGLECSGPLPPGTFCCKPHVIGAALYSWAKAAQSPSNLRSCSFTSNSPFTALGSAPSVRWRNWWRCQRI